MNRFSPTLRTLEPHDVPDPLAGAVVQSLGRPFNGWCSWGVVKTLVLGVISFGLWPLLTLPRRFRKLIVVEQQQLLHLAEWMRQHSAHPETTALGDAARRVGFRWQLWVVSVVLAVVTGAVFVRHFSQTPLDWERLIGATYGMRWLHRSSRISPDLVKLSGLWTIALSLAYAAHWLQVQLHVSDVRRFANAFNRVATSEGLRTVEVPGVGLGARPIWAAGAVMMVLLGGVWGVPMMLAAGVQRRYTARSADRVRGELAERVRAMLLLRRPTMRVPVPVMSRRTCANDRCKMPQPAGATFCPRCGTRLVVQLNQVA